MNKNVPKSIMLIFAFTVCICGCNISESTENQDNVFPTESKAENTSNASNLYSTVDTNEIISDKAVDTAESVQKNTDVKVKEDTYTFINKSGMTIAERIAVPQGYERIESDPKSFLSFMRNYPLLPYGEPVRYYDGQKKADQQIVYSVFDLKMVNGDLQQCADSCLRLYTEYLQSIDSEDKISFHFTNGNICKYTKGQNTEEYLINLFSYAGTMSMLRYDTVQTGLNNMTAGDLFLKGGSPGHVMMIVDIAQDANGNRAFLIAQGYMPAQSFHLVKNIRHLDDPWYYENEIDFPCCIGTYEFVDNSVLRHPTCLDQ